MKNLNVVPDDSVSRILPAAKAWLDQDRGRVLRWARIRSPPGDGGGVLGRLMPCAICGREYVLAPGMDFLMASEACPERLVDGLEMSLGRPRRSRTR